MKQMINELEKSEEYLSYQEEVLSLIKSDESFYELLIKDNITDDEIKFYCTKFKRYYEDYNLNKKYKKLEECIKNNKFYRYILRKSNNLIEEYMIPFDCFQKFNKYVDKFVIKDFDILKGYKLSFKNIPRQDFAFKIVKQFKENNKTFYVYGGSNTYKTYSAIAFSNSLSQLKDVKSIAFIDVPTRFDIYNNLYYSFDEKEKITEEVKLLCDVDVLILDGLGEETKVEQIKDKVIIPILRERTKMKDKITFITSKYSLEELGKVYSSKNNEFSARTIVQYIKNSIKEPILSGKLPIK